MTLHGEGGNYVRNKVAADAEMVEQRLRQLTVLEVPEYSFRQSANGSIGFSRESQGKIVARQHYLIYTVEHVRLVLTYPCQLGSGEVARRIEQVTQAIVGSQCLESLLAIGHGTRVAPYNTVAYGAHLAVYTHQSVHLIGYAYALDVRAFGSCLCHNVGKRELGICPPHLGVLFSPTCLEGLYRSFLRRIERRSGTFATLNVNERSLDTATTDIKSQQKISITHQ